MNQINTLPSEKNFGLDFNYAVWTAGTTVMLANVPWNSDYRDIVRFDNMQTGLNAYLENQAGATVTIPNMTYAKPGLPVRINIPFNAAYKYNYLRAVNPAQPISGDESRSFYYFINDVRYVAPNTTELILQLDVFQTFAYSMVFGNCYIERGHIGIANQNAFSGYGRDYLTVPEGLDVGGEYRVQKRWTDKMGTARKSIQPFEGSYTVMVVSTTKLEGDHGTVAAPVLNSARGSMMENLPNGAEIYTFSELNFQLFMDEFSDKPWVTQGIISITVIPNGFELQGTPVDLSGISATKMTSGDIGHRYSVLENNWRDNISLGRYANLKKFLTFPYTVVEVTTYNGTPIVLKPESWQTPHIELHSLGHFAPPNPRVVIVPYRYNAGDAPAENDAYGELVNDGAEFLDMSTGIFNFPTFALVNNGYISYMAANANSIAFQHQSADWSQQRALAGNATSYDQATQGIATSQELNRLGVNAGINQAEIQNQTAVLQALRGAGAGLVGGASMGPAGIAGAGLGALSNAVGTAVDINARNQSVTVSTNLANAQNRAQTGNQGYVRDTNRDLADWAARGDYANAIASINAKVQDAKLTQPTTAGQVGGDAFNLAVHRWGTDVKVKMLSPAAMRAVGEYWLRYGYAVNQFGRLPGDLAVMSKFTYWKLRETYISSGPCPEQFKQTVRGIFEKGVTVWKNPNDIGNIDIADNTPLSGVTL